MSKVVINYKPEGKEWEEALNKAYMDANKKVKVDGFREGKAPRNVFEKKYGKENLAMDACDILLNKKYMEIIREGKTIPIVRPRVDIVKVDYEGMEANITLITDPEVKLKKYKGLGVKKDKVEVTKAEIDHEIEHLVEKYAELTSYDGKIKEGITAIIDFEGFKNNEPFEGGKAENYSLSVGSHTFIPGFEEGLIGLKKGDSKDLELTFPDDYMSEDLKGQKVVFKVKVNDLKERKLPVMDADFFKDLDMPGVSSKKELEEDTKAHLTAHKEKDTKNKFVDDLLTAGIKNMEIDLDEEIIEEEQQKMYETFVKRMEMQGINEELYFAYTNSSKEKILSEMKTEATKRLKSRYLLEAVAKEEKIEPTDKDAEKELEKLVKEYNTTKEELLKEFGDLDTLKYDLKMRQAIEVLENNN